MKKIYRNGLSITDANPSKTALLKNAHFLGEKLSHFDDYEDLTDSEALEMLEEFEDHAEKFGRNVGHAAGRSKAQRVMTAKHGNRFKSAQTKQSRGLLRTKGRNSQFNAYVNILVKRVSANIALPLPFIIFGVLQFATSYANIIGSYLPTGVTLTNVTQSATGGVILEFTQGANVDTVTIECNQVGYKQFLAALNTDQFDVGMMRYSLSDPTQLAQYQQLFQLGTKSLFGKASQTDFPIEMHKTPNQFQNAIIDIKQSWAQDKESFLVGNIIDAASLSINLNMFITNYYKYNAKSVLNG